MFQRLKGAIDSRIAEEQARQRAAVEQQQARQAPGGSRAGVVRRSSSNARSPANRARKREGEADPKPTFPNGKAPDPNEFEPEFIIGEDEAPSRTATPEAHKEEADNSGTGEQKEDDGVEDKKGGEAQEAEGEKAEPARDARAAPPQIPLEVRKRLLRLEKLEPKYQELLRSYRIAHAKVLTIDPFEATLRENTPLTSIADPGALVEYLNQVNLKANMVMDELKRMSKEKDEMKSKLGAAEKDAADTRQELEKLREKQATTGAEETPTISTPKDITSPTVKSPAQPSTDTLPTVSASTSPTIQADDTSEDFFSYESEVPRLESQLRQSQDTSEKLEVEKEQLKNELAVAQESAEQLVRNLETATRDLQTMRESKDKLQTVMNNSEKDHQKKLADVKDKLQKAEVEVEQLRQNTQEHEKIVAEFKGKISTLDADLESLRNSTALTTTNNAELQKLQEKHDALETKLSVSEKAATEHQKRHETMTSLVQRLQGELREEQATKEDIADEMRKLMAVLKGKTEKAEKEAAAASDPASTSPPEVTGMATNAGEGGSKKKNKKKKKGGKAATEGAPSADAAPPSTPATPAIDTQHDTQAIDTAKAELEARIAELEKAIEEKDAAIARLNAKLKDQEDLTEEIEGLKQDLLNVGSEHVEAKDKLKELQAEKTATLETVEKLEKEVAELRTKGTKSEASEQERQKLTEDFQSLKSKADTLEIELSAAQQLAQTRFKDLTDLRDVMHKAQPELNALRKEVAELKGAKEDVTAKIAELRKLEGRERDLKLEIGKLRSQLLDKDSEVRNLNDKASKSAKEQAANEIAIRQGQADFKRLDSERREAVDARDRVNRDYTRAQEELRASRESLRSLEKQVEKLTHDTERLRDDIELKSAQYASAQSLMTSMQDQTQEMGAQMKEVRERCESLEEELADAHRLLSERSREGETMRRLLADVEGRADNRIKEMRERMDLAVEERDRAEDQANSMGRRKARELEELKQKARDAEREMRRAVADKEDLEAVEKEMRRQKDELEKRTTKTTEEVSEVRQAMSQLRDALDDGERQARELEKEKGDLRRVLEETQQRLDKLQRSSKLMAEELKSAKSRAAESNNQSSRSSLDMAASPGRVNSPLSKSRMPSISQAEGGAGGGEGKTDYVYLKNILLQFLEQKDKKHQMQLVPVLGMLLRFDRKDEQKWMAAISTR